MAEVRGAEPTYLSTSGESRRDFTNREVSSVEFLAALVGEMLSFVLADAHIWT